MQALKIDRMFVAGMTDNPGDAAIVRSIISLAGEIGLTVVAEGVETEEQRRALRLLGCDLLQGYLLGLPSPGRPDAPLGAALVGRGGAPRSRLRSCRILDTPPEPVFDRIVDLAVTAVPRPDGLPRRSSTSDRAWLKARVGFDADEMPRTWAFCDHALDSSEPLVVPDTMADDRFKNNAFVTGSGGDPRLRRRAPRPRRRATRSGRSACSTTPREFGPDQIADLRTLADQIVAELGVRRSLVDLSTRTVVAAAVHGAD